ncbi:MAG: Kae1-associated serine/threonine protein kinase [Candidatus Altiarchaeales archaeon]|nr:Kae1-associated serine/threonine protein kinase [Candidatus Altiarchaeota archaeon]MBU4266968.1 Kae1-associated serine/threonine protein kinase [Candidatus Altiarchaeota archaeon]MBU4342126.1 Kae1-associated serine/threonine protein kinase [Candidatus Altiarchaeota archaeon]MBU4437433.1 Kae1-associated serine/threonine protein kinase [Candidatus Altiarchaeota archaeon]MCG2782842.1 Kae1-associated serine/threonine protein kinase [Candidatus Altiarchaeales archaeon]
MKIVAKGAEANLYMNDGNLVKERIKKEYRVEELDERLRKLRTKRESKLLENAKRVGVPVPRIHKTDVKEKKIVMEFLEGRILKDVIDGGDEKAVKQLSMEIGALIAKLHDHNIVHNDLTTSNMILKDNKVYFIDFGLGMTSTRVEDKAMDLVVLKKALHATHTNMFELMWNSIIDEYARKSENKEILSRIKTIEKRGRYV